MNNNETNQLLRKILKWQKLQSLNILKDLIPHILDNEKKELAYELTDGENSQSIIAKRANIATGTLSNWWNIWHSYGIVDKEDNKYKKIISLKDLRISLGKINKSKRDS